MTRPAEFSKVRYLDAKRHVDDRALHRPTLDRLAAALSSLDRRPLRVLEVGAGTGTMLRRLLAWGVLPDRVRYLGLDLDADAVARGRDRLTDWAREEGYAVEPGEGDAVRLTRGAERVSAAVRVGDALPYAAATDGDWDLVVGCSFLDLVDPPAALATLFDALSPGGLAYFPVTFDGVTGFYPVDDEAFESRLLSAYHETMRGPESPAGHRTGRTLFGAVPAAGGEVVAAGGSDWVVTPTDGGYPDDEAYFLHHVVHLVEGAVEGLDAGRVADWADRRHGQIAAGDLTYHAHNVDVLARVPR